MFSDSQQKFVLGYLWYYRTFESKTEKKFDPQQSPNTRIKRIFFLQIMR